MIKIIDLQFGGMPECIASFLVETREGPILFETGPHSTLPRLENKLAEYGYQTSDLKHVFITHIHLDHAGAAWAFAEKGANIYLHPLGKKHMQDPSRLLESARRIYQDQMDSLWGTLKPIPENQLITLEHGQVVQVGEQKITAWHSPGHAVHHIAWQIGDKLVTGDVAGVKISKGRVEAPCPPPDIQIEDWMRSLDLIAQLNVKEFYLTHFGRVTDVDAHLSDLRKILQSWKAWMQPYAEKQADWKAVIPEFKAFISAERKKDGMSEEMVQKYDNANPIWMSVAGLMRYWRKRG